MSAAAVGYINFKISFKWHSCGGILSGASQVIEASKNLTYPISCGWKVQYSDDSIMVNFTKFDLGQCNETYIKIKYGLSLNL